LKIFARLGKTITIAARQGGADLLSNKALADAIELAKAASFPKDTMERAIARATNKDQADFKESSFEVYGHGGCGIYIDVLTDNANRAAADIRTIVNKQNMKIGSPGSVAFNFERMGVVRILADNIPDTDALLMAALDAEADECELDPFDDEQYRISVAMDGLQRVRKSLAGAGYKIESAVLEMIPKSLTEVTDSDAELNFAAIELLEDLDDVDAVATNMAV
jgi:YebC/PmpR family DNA-binding regulatory protein